MRPRRIKEKKVKLVTPDGQESEFGVQHAERILDLGPERNGGWALDPNSEYTYTYENGLRLKTDKGNSAKA